MLDFVRDFVSGAFSLSVSAPMILMFSALLTFTVFNFLQYIIWGR